MNIKNYTLLEERYIEEQKATCYVFRHDQSGAKVVYLSCPEEDNKVFGIAFKTLPENDYGIPHILEHTVLNGSRKYPVKEPFVDLLKGSLNTFLNAMTAPDMTIYPIASRNEKDFMNLMDVYLDAVFYPNVKKNPFIFRQEGWHYELNAPEDPIVYKGVVYNEMKGAFSSPDEVLMTEINRAMYPESVYSMCSGGDPISIPQLTYEEFKAFHDTYYHPANSMILFYGNGDVEKHLTYVDEEYLKNFQFDERSANIHIEEQPMFDAPREIVKTYAVAEGEDTKDKAYLAYSAMLPPVRSSVDSYGLNLLSAILGSGESSPLKLALLKAGIGKDISVDIESSMYQPALNIIAKNANEEQKDEFVKIIRSTLEDVVKNGLDPKLVEACINSSLFRLREANFGSAPKGLIIGFNCWGSWLYGCDPLAFLTYEEEYKTIKATPRFFEDRIQKLILDNPHTVITTLLPEPGKNAKQAKKDEEILAAYKATLSEQEIEDLIAMNKELTRIQEAPDAPEDLAKIPLLERSDLTVPEPFKPAKEAKIGGKDGAVYTDNTNHIIYTSLQFNMKDIAKEDLPYAGLLAACLDMVNTKNFAYTELDNEVGCHLGGLNFEVKLIQKLDESFNAYFTMGSKFLLEEIDSFVDLAKEILLTSDLTDTKRLLEIISETRSQMEDGMIWAGNAVAQSRAFSYFESSYAYREKVSGVDYFRFLKDLEANFEEKKDELVAGLERVKDILIRQDEVKVRVAFTESDETEVLAKLGSLVAALPEGMSEKATLNADRPEPVMKNEALVTPGQVQFVCRAGRFKEEYNGAMAVLSQVLGLDYLWTKIRVQGGAYGCRRSIDRMGRVAMVSYRDPNLKETIKVFEEAGPYMEKFDVDDREMTKYIIGTMAALDPVKSVSMKASFAMDAMETGVTYEMIRKVAEEAMNTTQEDVRRAAKVLEEAMAEPFICVVGSEPKITAAKEIFGDISQLM